MGIASLLLKRQAAKKLSAMEEYLKLIRKVAERGGEHDEASITSLEQLSATLGKNPDTVDKDIAATVEIIRLEPIAAEHDAHEKALAEKAAIMKSGIEEIKRKEEALKKQLHDLRVAHGAAYTKHQTALAAKTQIVQLQKGIEGTYNQPIETFKPEGVQTERF